MRSSVSMIYFVCMSLQIFATSSYIQFQYKEHLAQLKLTDDVIVSYLVTLNPVTISEIENKIEEKLNYLHLPKAEIKKIFFTCVELIQNQFLYGISDEVTSESTYFIISKNGNSIKVITAKRVHTRPLFILSKITKEAREAAAPTSNAIAKVTASQYGLDSSKKSIT